MTALEIFCNILWCNRLFVATMIRYYNPMSERTKIFEKTFKYSDIVNPNDYKEETVNELAEYKQYEEDMQSQIKTDLEEVQST